MAGEFEKITIDGKVAWKCNQCGVTIKEKRKPRGHRCFVNSTLTTPQIHSQAPQRQVGSAPGNLHGNPTVAQPQTSNATNSTPRNTRQRAPSNNQGLRQKELSELIKVFENQNLQTQQQLEQQRQKDERMMQMMMQNQQMLMNRQERHEEMLIQTIENLGTNAAGSNVNTCSKPPKKTKCPRWEANEPFKAFIDRLEIWDNITEGPGKYLDLIESLQATGKAKEKDKVELEIRNKIVNPADDAVIKILIPKMKKWFRKPFIDTAATSWRVFIHLLREHGENIHDFILRFETAEADLKLSNVEVTPLTLAIHLLEAINVDENQKRNIISKVTFEDNPNVYENVKDAIKLLEGSLVTKEKSDKSETDNDVTTETALYGENRKFFGKGKYSNQNKRYNDRHRSSRSNRNHDDDNRRKSRSGSRSRNGDHRSRSRSHSRDSSWSHNSGQHAKEDTRNVHVNFNYKDKEDDVEAVFAVTSEHLKRAIIDTAATKTCAGKMWLEDYRSGFDKDTLKSLVTRKERRSFRFGNSVRYPSEYEIDIPFKLGSNETILRTSVINANIPLLIGLPDLEKLK